MSATYHAPHHTKKTANVNIECTFTVVVLCTSISTSTYGQVSLQFFNEAMNETIYLLPSEWAD